MNFAALRLISKAERYWARGETLPLDLAAAMVDLGLDVETLERKYRQ